MTKQEKLAGYLLATYYTGCGDAGVRDHFQELHETSDKELAGLIKEDGTCMEFEFNGKVISQSDYFMFLAGQILQSFEQ